MIELEDIKNRCDAIEEGYEFMLAYAAQGIADDRESQYGSQLRELLSKAVDAATDLPEAYAAVVSSLKPASSQQYVNFLNGS